MLEDESGLTVGDEREEEEVEAALRAAHTILAGPPTIGAQAASSQDARALEWAAGMFAQVLAGIAVAGSSLPWGLLSGTVQHMCSHSCAAVRAAGLRLPWRLALQLRHVDPERRVMVLRQLWDTARAALVAASSRHDPSAATADLDRVASSALHAVRVLAALQTLSPRDVPEVPPFSIALVADMQRGWHLRFAAADAQATLPSEAAPCSKQDCPDPKQLRCHVAGHWLEEVVLAKCLVVAVQAPPTAETAAAALPADAAPSAPPTQPTALRAVRYATCIQVRPAVPASNAPPLNEPAVALPNRRRPCTAASWPDRCCCFKHHRC